MTTQTDYQIKYNRATSHIAGLDEATTASADGMTYSLSACGALSKGLYLANGFASNDLTAVLDNARKGDRKLCKNCEKAALRIIAKLEQDAAAEASQVAEQVEQPTAHKIAIIKDNKGNERVHAAGCADVKREATKFHYDPCFITATTREDVARDWYGDVASDNYEVGTPEWEQEILECMDLAMTFLPCCELPSETVVEIVNLAQMKADIAELVEIANAKRYGKAQLRVLEFLKARPGQTMVVSLVVGGLAEQGIKTWWRATNDALKALAADPASGIVEIPGGNRAYKFKQ